MHLATVAASLAVRSGMKGKIGGVAGNSVSSEPSLPVHALNLQHPSSRRDSRFIGKSQCRVSSFVTLDPVAPDLDRDYSPLVQAPWSHARSRPNQLLTVSALYSPLPLRARHDAVMDWQLPCLPFGEIEKLQRGNGVPTLLQASGEE